MEKRNILPAASLHAIVNYSKCSGHHKIRCLGGYSHYQSYLFNFLLQPALNSVFSKNIIQPMGVCLAEGAETENRPSRFGHFLGQGGLGQDLAGGKFFLQITFKVPGL